MIQLNKMLKRAELPYTVRFHGVSEETFDALVDEDTKAELLNGVMIVHSPASPRHNSIAAFLRHLMSGYCEERAAGNVFGPDDLIRLAPDRKVAPDAFFLCTKRVPSPLPEQEFEIAPDSVIEVLSPSTRREDLNEKRPAYQEAGVSDIWFVDPDNQQVLVDRRRKKRYSSETISEGRVTSVVLEGFWVAAGWLGRTAANGEVLPPSTP